MRRGLIVNALRECDDIIAQRDERIRELEADNKRLRTRLQVIADAHPDWNESLSEYARTALLSEDEK